MEEIFLLTEYCHISWTEAWDMPVEYRKWLIERKRKENERIQAARKKEKKPPPPKPSGPKKG